MPVLPKAPTVGVLLPYLLYISLRLPKSDRLLAFRKFVFQKFLRCVVISDHL
jgi:hypothetical protein